jgi:hypothetical protein
MSHTAAADVLNTRRRDILSHERTTCHVAATTRVYKRTVQDRGKYH